MTDLRDETNKERKQRRETDKGRGRRETWTQASPRPALTSPSQSRDPQRPSPLSPLKDEQLQLAPVRDVLTHLPSK